MESKQETSELKRSFTERAQDIRHEFPRFSKEYTRYFEAKAQDAGNELLDSSIDMGLVRYVDSQPGGWDKPNMLEAMREFGEDAGIEYLHAGQWGIYS